MEENQVHRAKGEIENQEKNLIKGRKTKKRKKAGKRERRVRENKKFQREIKIRQKIYQKSEFAYV